MDVNQVEDMNGIRFSFTVWPTNRIDAAAVSVPIGCLYTPLKRLSDHPLCQYDPVVCHNCRGILNPYSSVDFTNKTWTCPLCKTRSLLPQSYHGMTETCLPAELLPDFTTVEYEPPGDSPALPPVFVLVVDTCLAERELDPLKNLLMQTVSALPPQSLVGFLSYGSIAYVHELRVAECPRSFIFNGAKTYTADKMREFLSIIAGQPNPFVLPVNDAEQMLNSIRENLEVDSFPVPKGDRAQRCTGVTLDLAVTLLEAAVPMLKAHVILFTSGLITKGPGMMASIKREEFVRQHREIDLDQAPLSTSSKEYFRTLREKVTDKGVIVSCLSASFEESGLYELSSVITATGGFLITSETWADERFSHSILKFFRGGIFENSGGDVSLAINISKEFKVAGCVGPCFSGKRPQPDVASDTIIEEAGTVEWKACGVLPTTTFAFFFDIAVSKVQPIRPGTLSFIQFVSRFRRLATGKNHIRVTTACIRFADLTTTKHDITAGFDQEAAAVLVARLAMWKLNAEETVDVVHWVDRLLIKFCRLFGTYTPNEPGTFSLDGQFGFLPLFMYHFRRSPFLTTFNSTPDHTTFLRHSLLTEDVTNSLFMVQPTLMRYAFDGAEPRAVLLDTTSIQPDVMLLLDTFFRIVLWHGSTVVAWRQQGYQDKEEYPGFKTALDAPKAEADALVAERFPTPAFVSCDQGSSQARYLLTRCNPSEGALVGQFGSAENLGTDEPSLEKFMAKLKQMAVIPG
jgi:protein transport protein SEC23